jgi:hypothetical protein
MHLHLHLHLHLHVQVQVHPIEGRVGLKSKHSGQLGNCVAAAAQD